MEIPKNKIIASGPVIIENNKVLLVKEMKQAGASLWLFPGGKAEPTDESLEAACEREAFEEIGTRLEIIKKLRTISFTKENIDIELNHFLAKRLGEIIPGVGIVSCEWHDLNNLPPDCNQNIYEIINDYLREKEIYEIKRR